MNKTTSKKKPVGTDKNKRRTQERSELTRAKLLSAATRLFAEQGYDGVAVRDIENAAGVQRGLMAYHFKNKENQWKAVADQLFGLMRSETASRAEILKDLPPREQLALLIRFYVRFSARHPELSRLMSQEGRHDSWRIRYLIEKHIGPTQEELQRVAGQALGIDEEEFLHWYYIVLGASSLLFSQSPECRILFGVDPLEDEIVDRHADLLADLLLGPDRVESPSR